MGTPVLSATILEALLAQQYNVVGVVTKSDKPAGRNSTIKDGPVKRVALAHSLPLLQPEKMTDDFIAQLTDWKPDLIIVVAYGKILPQAVLDIPGFGCLNFHPSLLPKWRGASPIQNAILSGDTETGVTLMLMDRGMDTGDILAQIPIPIDPKDTTQTLTDRLTPVGIKLLLSTLPRIIQRQITPQKQNDADATLCQIIERSDGHILWSDDAVSIYNRYRALSPWPGVYTYWQKKDDLLRLKLLSLSYQQENPASLSPLGTVIKVNDKIGVQTMTGVIFLETVQLEGKNPVPISEFVRGNETLIGSCLK